MAERWALMTHPDQVINGKLVQEPMRIQESSIPAAAAQGWKFVAWEADELESPLVPTQSNPRRQVHGDCAVDRQEEDGS